MFKIDAATLIGSCVIWVVFSLSNGLPLLVWTEGHYMMKLGKIIKTIDVNAQAPRQWAKGWMWVTVHACVI